MPAILSRPASIRSVKMFSVRTDNRYHFFWWPKNSWTYQRINSLSPGNVNNVSMILDNTESSTWEELGPRLWEMEV